MKTVLTILILVVALGVAIGGIIAISEMEITNRCIPLYSRESVGGRIYRSVGLLGGGVTDYRIQYKGMRRRTQEDCEVVRSVTEREYERAMYGETRKNP